MKGFLIYTQYFLEIIIIIHAVQLACIISSINEVFLGRKVTILPSSHSLAGISVTKIKPCFFGPTSRRVTSNSERFGRKLYFGRKKGA